MLTAHDKNQIRQLIEQNFNLYAPAEEINENFYHCLSSLLDGNMAETDQLAIAEIGIVIFNLLNDKPTEVFSQRDFSLSDRKAIRLFSIIEILLNCTERLTTSRAQQLGNIITADWVQLHLEKLKIEATYVAPFKYNIYQNSDNRILGFFMLVVLAGYSGICYKKNTKSFSEIKYEDLNKFLSNLALLEFLFFLQLVSVKLYPSYLSQKRQYNFFKEKILEHSPLKELQPKIDLLQKVLNNLLSTKETISLKKIN